MMKNENQFVKLIVIIGARPQFIKHYPFEEASKGKLDLVTVHTGQHYDNNMSAVFFEQLGMKKPHFLLNVGSGKHGEQTAKMMIEIEDICCKIKPQALMVYGDTNSTLAGALVASKLHIPLIHVEAGLRSYNKKMPEEVNRILTDHISDLLFVPSKTAVTNLKNEGINKGIYLVGDIMKDLILYIKEKNLFILPDIEKPYYYVTLHRPYNVDHIDRFIKILSYLNELKCRVIFAAHPRTLARINISEDGRNIVSSLENITVISPQGYLENIGYLIKAEALITDSGGMQKEAYWLNKKCVTIRSETEWVETMKGNANSLVFQDLDKIQHHLNDTSCNFDSSLYGNGDSAIQMVDTIIDYINAI